jgi:hypothetical protein
MNGLKPCFVPEYAWATVKIQFHYLESDYVAAQYAWILHRPWKIIRGYWYLLLQRMFESRKQVRPGGRPVCGRQARRRFGQ